MIHLDPGTISFILPWHLHCTTKPPSLINLLPMTCQCPSPFFLFARIIAPFPLLCTAKAKEVMNALPSKNVHDLRDSFALAKVLPSKLRTLTFYPCPAGETSQVYIIFR